MGRAQGSAWKPSDAETLAGARSQVERMDALDAVREFRLRVVVATDLIARGVDLGAPLLGSLESCGIRNSGSSR